MAIDAYTGLPRSGKSYSVVKNVILPSLKEGRHVHTNIPLTELLREEFGELIHQFPGDWFTDKDLPDRFPPGAVVVMDELWRRWPAGLKANNVNFKDKEFLAEHGHNVDQFGNTTRVVLVSQDLSQIAAFARDLVAMTYRSTKLDAVGADSRFRVDIYRGSVTGQKPPKTQLVRSTYDSYSPEIYKYYRSSTKSQTGDVGNESRADKRANIWRSPFIIFSVVAPVLLIPLLLWWLYTYFMSGFGMVEQKPVVEAAGPVNPAPGEPQPVAAPKPVQAKPAPEPPKPTGPVISTTWRVAGYARRSSDKSRPASSGWSSITGYGDMPDTVKINAAMPDVVILSSSMGAIRNVPSTECKLLADGTSWTCDIDGELVTPWSGQGTNNTWASSDSLVGRTASAASGATAGDRAITNPAP